MELHSLAKADKTGNSADVANSSVLKLLTDIATEILQTPVDTERSLVAQGLDSLGAAEILEALEKAGYSVNYSDLLGEVSTEELSSLLLTSCSGGPVRLPDETLTWPVDLTGAQTIWAELDSMGWGSWSNISLCLSLPASLIPAANLPAMLQCLCDANQAMGMRLSSVSSPEKKILQRVVSNFQLPVQMQDAPRLEKDALRIVETFEGEHISPFEPSTRALVLSSTRPDGRHWLCITMHHIFCDRISMQRISQQIAELIEQKQFHTAAPSLRYTDYAGWQNRPSHRDQLRQSRDALRKCLANSDTSSRRPVPQLADAETFDLGNLPSISNLSASEYASLEAIALELETTLPLLLHGLLSVLLVRLTRDEKALSGEADILLCHVVSNREHHACLKDLIGCLDTSVPVAVKLAKTDTLDVLCTKTRQAFANAYPHAANTVRGEWISRDVSERGYTGLASIFERFPHINIVRTPQFNDRLKQELDIREHTVRRTQKTRWGLLLRITLPPVRGTKEYKGKKFVPETTNLSVTAVAEQAPLAVATQYCFVKLLRHLQSQPMDGVRSLQILKAVDGVIEQARFAATQVRSVAALVRHDTGAGSFIYDKLIARQKRWYVHDEHHQLRRDDCNRFVGTTANPFPFTQLDKLKERQYLETLAVPLPKLLHVLPKNGLQDALIKLAPSLPDSFAFKPVGAGHSFGVTLVRGGLDITRNAVAFDAAVVAAEMTEMAERGYCVHEGRAFPFNFSSFLIEEFVSDEMGLANPTDYKVFMIGDEVLWIQIHFIEGGHSWVAFVNEDFELLPQPAWDPTTCWRTHRTLVSTDPGMVAARKPKCLTSILQHSRRLGGHMGIFVRLDWFADRKRGPLMGEITTFPHMLQPRSFYSSWANNRVRSSWQDPDGSVPQYLGDPEENHSELVKRTGNRLRSAGAKTSGLSYFLPKSSRAAWAIGDAVSWQDLREHIDGFDLSHCDVAAGERVAILIPNGVELAATLLATMNRYIAVPIGSGLPAASLASQLCESNAKALLVIAGTQEAKQAHALKSDIPGLKTVELVVPPSGVLANLPTEHRSKDRSVKTSEREVNDTVLVLRTSGSTGEPKSVAFTLSRLVLAGASIGQSLRLSSADVGLSMLPLHHIGGIACNLIAPLLAGSPMRFCGSFDPKAFFDALRGKQGATWCYIVPSMWKMILDYADTHQDIRRDDRWHRLRILRSAGAELPHEMACSLASLFGKNVSILPTYGMTEAMPIAAPPLAYRLEHPGSVGQAAPDVSIEIVDPYDETGATTLPDGMTGEITVSGPGIVRHQGSYDSADAADFTPRGHFRTGDLGNLAADGSGWLFVTGRKKEAINRGGETIAPGFVEAELRKYPNWPDDNIWPELMAVPRTHSVLGEDVALVVTPVSSKPNTKHFHAWATKHLPECMVPQTLVFAPQLPQIKTGKPSRILFAKRLNALLPPAELGRLQCYKLGREQGSLELLEDIQTSQLPADAHEPENVVTLDVLMATLRQFIRDDVAFDPDTRFDDAGVNSLAAVDLAAHLNERFQCQLPQWILSDFPTPRALLSQIKMKQTQKVVARPTPDAEVPAAMQAAPRATGTRQVKMLFLHGEGGDAHLMALSLQATHWSDKLDKQLALAFMDAPHLCEPKPQFHAPAMQAGLYNKPAYRSWGATQTDTLQASVKAVEDTLDKLGSINAIGGICDGGLVAALVASKRRDIELLFNFSPSPMERLASSVANTSWRVSCPTLHLISQEDEMHSLAQQTEILAHCEKALVLQHSRGHAVPVLDDVLKREIETVIRGIDPNPDRFPPKKLGAKSIPATWENETELSVNPRAQSPTLSSQECREALNGGLTKPSKATDPVASPEMLSEIEKLICGHDSIETAIVVGLDDPESSKQRHYAFVVLDPTTRLPPPDLKAFLLDKVAAHLIPERFVPLDALPRGSDGAIDLRSLKKNVRMVSRPDTTQSSELEQMLAKIWQDVLMLDHPPGVDEDFFDLGGFSLLAVILLQETERRIGKSMPEKALLTLSTVRALARELEADDIQGYSPATLAKDLNACEQGNLPAHLRQSMIRHTAGWKAKRARKSSLVFELNPNGKREPIFWCFQSFVEFRKLAAQLGSNQPVYGMRSAVNAFDKSEDNLEALAEIYAFELLSIHEQGSFVIGGTCQSAKIAFRVATILRDAGRHISLLCLHEQIVPYCYPGRVALFFGKNSDHSPTYYYDHPEESWRWFYSDRCSLHLNSATHGKHFHRPHIRHFASNLLAEIDIARESRKTDRGILSSKIPVPLLSPDARKAKIQAPLSITVESHEREVLIEVEITNSSKQTWPATVGGGIFLGYWLYSENKGIKPPIFYGLGNKLPQELRPNQSVKLSLKIAIPNRPGRYRADVDLFDNGICWFRSEGSQIASITVDNIELNQPSAGFERFNLRGFFGRRDP